ncbi:MAG: glycosyltransferase family 1 protein, partial [Patescibacteria group bacterium]|nr:glycosyltransferase family 1 protein [Patescibacteria group bacterium]
MSDKIHIAIDGCEANVTQRVGSNVYAFNIIKQISNLLRYKKKTRATVLLSQKPVADMPKERINWQYKIVKPDKFWTQWAEPWHLFFQQNNYDVLYTPGHYAPRLCPIPYVSSVMDLAFLQYQHQFRQTDLFQLEKWTKYSVKKASKVIAISQFTKKEIHQHYGVNPQNIIVAYPDVSLNLKETAPARKKAYFKKHGISQPYFLFVGTLQPRKNLVGLIQAYELFCEKQTGEKPLPKLVIAGKIGWLAEPILQKIKNSPVRGHIILTSFVPTAIKPILIKNALALTLVGLYEGFGIPALEALYLNTIPIVSESSSLPEVVGKAGLKVDP